MPRVVDDDALDAMERGGGGGSEWQSEMTDQSAIYSGLAGHVRVPVPQQQQQRQRQQQRGIYGGLAGAGGSRLWAAPAMSSRALQRSYTRPADALSSSSVSSSIISGEMTAPDKLLDCSAAARVWVYQFVFDAKMRAFGSARMLEQEVRKDAIDRVFLKVLDPVAPAAIDARPAWRRALHYVDGTMPAFTQWARRKWFPWIFLLDAMLRGSGQVMICNNPVGGAIALAALGVTSPWLLVCSM